MNNDMTSIPSRAAALFFNWPKTACVVLGLIASYAMAPFYVWPAMLVALSGFILIMARQTNPWRGAWCMFMFGMGYFTLGLWWVANALMMDIEDYWWAMGFSILGLPLLLSICWFIAGWVTVRLTAANTLARGVLLITLLMLAEYGRAFNLTGFPWTLFGYMWANIDAVTQLASLGGAYFVSALTVIWMGAPGLMWIARRHKLRQGVIAGIAVATFAGGYVYGAVRLNNHPTEMRTDTALVIVQPNLTPNEKWETGKEMDHFMRHVRLSQQGLDLLAKAPVLPKSVAIVWPETSLDEQLLLAVPEAPKALLDTMQGLPFRTALVSGLWRQENKNESQKPDFYNSIGDISVSDGKLNLDDIYDKHHLVPFGEFLPMEETLGLTPVVGFAGFKWGTGPKVLHSPVVPPVSPMICFEAIFPWYGASEGAEWLVNTSNDGWYGDTAGPYQHLAMTRYRAIEQGKPIARSATTGISAVIDPYGRVLQSLDYYRQGYLVSALPQYIAGGTLYIRFGEGLFFILLGLGIALTAVMRLKQF